MLELAYLTDDLVGLFVGLGTGIRQIHAIHAGHLGDEFLGEENGGDVAVGVGEVVELLQLFGHGVHDFGAAVANVDRPHATGHGIKILFAVDVGQTGALAFHEDDRVGVFEDLVLGQMMPHMLLIKINKLLCVGHDSLLCFALYWEFRVRTRRGVQRGPGGAGGFPEGSRTSFLLPFGKSVHATWKKD